MKNKKLEKQNKVLEKERQFSKPKKFKSITVMFTDFVDFTGTGEKLNAAESVEEINFYYSSFDEIIAKHGLEKIKTIDDSYVCAGGLPVANENHASDVIKAAMEIQQFVAVLNIERKKYNLPAFEYRLGIYSGPVVAGIGGTQKFSYDIWGDTVDIASRMKSECEPGKINISGSTYQLIKDDFKCDYRGKIAAGNKGFIDMYVLDHENNSSAFGPTGAENFIRYKLKRNLPPQLTYHGFHHTEDVLNAVLQIATAENINEDDMQLLRIAALFHDSGFTELYKDHEEKGCTIAREYLQYFGFAQKDIDCICGMIMATKIPQQPQTKLEAILCDADLDYLGRDDFYSIGKTLFEEFITYDIIKNEAQWNEAQIHFLESHHYFTDHSKKEREPQKEKYLAALKQEYKQTK
jgi:adenylate cyclase